ncbi:hypothetical protein MAUB1S_09690 [Mycolicibacterium aubagnense]
MKRAVLTLVEEVPYRALDTGGPGEVADRSRVDVDPADATEARLEATDTGRTLIEAFGATAKAAEQVEMPELYIDTQVRVHASPPVGSFPL